MSSMLLTTKEMQSKIMPLIELVRL